MGWVVQRVLIVHNLYLVSNMREKIREWFKDLIVEAYNQHNDFKEGCEHDFTNWSNPEMKEVLSGWALMGQPTVAQDRVTQSRSCIKCNKIEVRIII